jgi:hypothetical protein
MTRAGRRMVVLGAILATAASLSACKVLRRAESTPGALTSAAADAGTPRAAGCPLAAAFVDTALGGEWAVSSLPTGGCHYTRADRTILVSAVPLPKEAAGRRAALAQARKSCDAGSTQSVQMNAFVCRQDTLVEAAAISGNRLLVLCAAAGTDDAALADVRSELGTLIAAVATP